MKIDIGATVRTSEDEEVGRVERVILDPVTREVDALVIHKGLILTRDVVVPLSLVQEADKGGVRLRIGQVQLAGLPDFVEKHYLAGPAEQVIPHHYTPGSVLFPLAAPYSVPGVPVLYQPSSQEWQAPTGDVDVSEGTEVRSVDGPIGVVGEVLTDPLTDRVSAIKVMGGADLGRDIEIPIEFVHEIADDHVQLSLTTQEVLELPEPVTDRYLTVEGQKGGEQQAGGG